jgi:tetratricopeptide (TPR) repeat protein
MRILIWCLGWLLLSTTALNAQNSKLAQEYFNNGEYEKSSVLYEQLYQSNPNTEYFFKQYVASLTALERYQDSEKVIRKEMKRHPEQLQLYVMLGNLFEMQYRDEDAREQYDKAIKRMPADRVSIIKLAQAFTGLAKYDQAIQTYEKGGKLIKNEQIFAYNLGDLYRRKGDTAKMINSYLNSLAANPGRLTNLQTLFQRYLAEEDFAELQTQLYARIQEERESTHYAEMLTWVFIHKKDYRGALRQVKALDKRLRENGSRVFNLANVAANDGDFKTAIDGYDYIVSEKGIVSSYYIDAKREALRCKRLQLVSGYDYTEEQLRQLEAEYEDFLSEFGRSKITAPIMAELADLEALYLNDLNKAISILTEIVEMPGIAQTIQAKAKLHLGDYYLIQGERWEATLLYSQVDKAFEDYILGHEARFRNAKLSYFFGDFDWAQAQFEVLKASTSKLIANDALELSIFIMDNLGLDTTAASLQLYADAELLIFQNRFDDAFEKLDRLILDYPDHSLQDDVYYAKAKIYIRQREYFEAGEMLHKIIEEYPDGIRADNAIFELAGLYETHLNDLEMAKSLYESLFIDYSDSTFAVEARKRFRKLRGDDI